MRPVPPRAVTTAPPKGWRVWWTAARPRTLPLAATPVLAGTAVAWAEGAAPAWAPALAALACALAIQTGTNLHNDAADFERGNDRADRLGPLRVTAAGWASAAEVRRAALMTFGLAFLLGIYLVAAGGWPILAIGLASLAAGWGYSGGPRPVSHTPFGELFVLAFFGLAAVAGSAWLQAAAISTATLLTGLAVGLPAAAVLMVNNTRDLVADRAAGRLTLAAVLGPVRARQAYAAMMLTPFALLAPLALLTRPGTLLALLALPAAVGLIRRLRAAEGVALNEILAGTARAHFLFGGLLALGLQL